MIVEFKFVKMLQEFSCSILTNLNSTIITADIYYAANLALHVYLDRPFNAQVKLAKVKENKAPGQYRIPYEFYVNASDDFLYALANVYTQILNDKSLVMIFEKSIVLPIHKKRNINDANNFRGISFMNCAEKIMKGAIHERLTNWLNNHQIINEFQAGFANSTQLWATSTTFQLL